MYLEPLNFALSPCEGLEVYLKSSGHTVILSTLCCIFKVNADKENNGCQIFRLGDMVQLAGGNFSR